ncbi:MAG: hypothetical protein KY459_11880 [Acidobacteria bacterium]|nr:hypothetical protein [Acidobacteriota bacterium]
MSDVGTFGEHRPIGYLTRLSFERVAKLIPADTPIIIESIVSPDRAKHEVDQVKLAFAA